MEEVSDERGSVGGIDGALAAHGADGDQPDGEVLALEAEVRRLKGEPQPGREVYPDAREIEWGDPDAASLAIARIMQKG